MSSYNRAYQNWTKEEEALLIGLLQEGKGQREIAARLERSPNAVLVRMEYLAVDIQRFETAKDTLLKYMQQYKQVINEPDKS